MMNWKLVSLLLGIGLCNIDPINKLFIGSILHSPIKFNIDPINNLFITKDPEGEFTSVAQMFSNQDFNLSQIEGYIAEPNKKVAVRGEDLSDPWSLTASFKASKANRILTIIQLDVNGNKIAEIKRLSDSFECGDWTIKAELDPKKSASIYITNPKIKATFSAGLKHPEINGETVKLKNKNTSLLYDTFDGQWELKEAVDSSLMPTGNMK